MQEYVLDPGMGPTGVEGWGAVGCSPVPVLCQVIFVEQVLEDFVFWWGFFNIFFSLASFPFSPLYVTAQIFSLSAPVGGRLSCLEDLGPFSAPSGCCTERMGRGEGMLRLPVLAALVSTGLDWPEKCQMRQRGPPASLLGSCQGCIHPPRALSWWEAGSRPASFPADFLSSQTSLHLPWPLLLRPALGRVLGP